MGGGGEMGARRGHGGWGERWGLGGREMGAGGGDGGQIGAGKGLMRSDGRQLRFDGVGVGTINVTHGC